MRHRRPVKPRRRKPGYPPAPSCRSFPRVPVPTVRDRPVRGFMPNEVRLAERGLGEARATLDLLARTAPVDDAGQAVPDLIAGDADTWRPLPEYDEDRLPAPPGMQPSPVCSAGASAQSKHDPMARNEASFLFGTRPPTPPTLTCWPRRPGKPTIPIDPIGRTSSS